MKIKGCSNAHFIQAIRGGLVVKVPSADSHGRPSIKFKSITDIYESEDTEKPYSGSRPGTYKHSRSTLLPLDDGNVDVVVPFKSMDKEIVGIELEYKTDTDGEDEICTSNVDDDALGSMTLKEIKKRSKTKKRRFPRSLDPIKQEIGPGSHSLVSSNKQGHLLPWKNDADPNESSHGPLSKKLKTMTNDVARGDCVPSTSPIPVDTCDQILNFQSSSHNPVETHGPFDPHIENVERDNLDSQNVVHVAEGSTFGSHVKMSYWREQIDGLPNEVNQGASRMRRSFSLCEETCVLKEVSEEYLDPSNSLFSASSAESSGESMKASSPETHKAFPSFISGPLEEVTTTHSVPCLSPMEVFPVTDNLGSEKYPNIQDGLLSCDTDNDRLIQLYDTTLSSTLKCNVICYGGDRSVPDTNDDSDNKEDASDPNPQIVESKTLTHDHDMVTINTLKPTELSNGGNGCIINVDGEVDKKDINPDLGPTATSTTSEFPSACVDMALQGSSDIHYSDTTKGLKVVEAHKDFLRMKTRNPPKRLFSTRKAISPTSQEKLCRELDAGGCDNMDTFKCREKLFIEKQTESDNLLTKSIVEKEDMAVMLEESINKLDNNNTGTPQSIPRGILKVPPVSCPKPSSGTGCTPIYTCAAKAIEFSQRQMHDIDSLAMKLMKELKSMKGIVEDSLCAEMCEVPSSKYTADQIKSAIENVAEAEETTKKWLSMMTKDCSRFCKIMKSSQKKSLMASGYEVKKRKKISFADEDGGVLCHVKVYEDPQASSSHCL